MENNPSIRWCPAARCERAVRLTRPGPGDSDLLSFPLLPSPAVDCGKGHLFCWYTRQDLHVSFCVTVSDKSELLFLKVEDIWKIFCMIDVLGPW